MLSWATYVEAGDEKHIPRAVYLATDSRITWGSADRRWEAGRKTFAPATLPHLFGYSGDVVLPGLLLGQITSAIDAGILIDPAATAQLQHEAVLEAIRAGVAAAKSTPTLDFTIHHLMRDRTWPDTSFRAWTINYTAATNACVSNELTLPAVTGVIAAFGSGAKAAEAEVRRWTDSEIGDRSRAILSGFQDAIASGADPLSGGAAQLAGLYMQGPPVQIGFIVGGKRYLNGLEVGITPLLKNVEWRDGLGQNCDPRTGKAKQGARRYGRPATLVKPPAKA
ncbi:hypothetical protein [Sphingomonas sp.]|uniref:hypothetical protein n=1 Tax=Sphingomonas sp. TaxID=28214 RepID=UPI002E343820|nr:hypothetical protein [Sphingomonas sp.]HEX4694454.1 hypothetical protein [Sphingomonas sp.]